MKVEMVSIDLLRHAEYNPRRLSKEDFEHIKESIEAFGFVENIVVNSAPGREGVIIGGNQRFEVAKKLSIKEVPVHYVNIPDLKKEQELNVRLNRNLAEWDFDILANQFEEEDLLAWGFKPIELGKIFETNEEQNEVPSPRATTEIKNGDIFELGRHRLVCGDCTSIEDVSKLMNGKKADFCFTSPPYWVGFEYEKESDKESILAHIEKSVAIITSVVTKKVTINTGNISSIETAEKITGKRQPALLIDWWISAFNRHGFLLRHIRVWAKCGGIQPSRRSDKIDMHWEYLGTFTTEEETAGFVSTFRNPSDDTGQIGQDTPEWAVKGVWTDIKGNAREGGHCAAFPVELVSRYFMMYSKRGRAIFEPYGGSGTSIIAAEKLQRIAYAMEIDPIYCQLIIDRWEKFTGKKAEKINGQLVH